MRITPIIAGLLVLAAPALAGQEEKKSPVVLRWEKFQAEKGYWPPQDGDCNIQVIEGFRVAFTPQGEIVTDPRDCLSEPSR